MLVSVIITTKNEERNIGNCLKSVLAQTYPKGKMEIVVVDNNSTDRTKEIINGFGRGLAPLSLKVFDGGPERSAQRNFGVERAAGKYFLYLDADMILGEKVIEECAEKMERDGSLAGLYIPEKIKGKRFWGKVRDFERRFYDGTAIDAVRFIRKDKFLEAGGFDEKLYAGEDWDLTKRLKGLGRMNITKAVLYHDEAESNLSKYLAKKKYYARNLDVYVGKWGKGDPDVKKQFGFWYRFVGVFTEDGKWKKLLRHPFLAMGMLALRFFVGFVFVTAGKSAVRRRM